MLRRLMLLTALAGQLAPAGAGFAADRQEVAETLDQLVATFDDGKCRECHPEIYDEWQASWHSRSLVSSTGILATFLQKGLGEQWKTPVTKAHLMKCLYCHAPTVSRASEALALQIADWALAAEGDDPEARNAARQRLARLNVGCTVCHNLRATELLPGLGGAPRPGAVYGPTGATTTAHDTVGAPQLGRSLFCMQCHGRYTAPDGELLTCATVPGSYQNSYKGRGGARSCQDCHVRTAGRGHRMPGGHDLDMVREALGLKLEVDAYRHLPGKVPGVGDKTARVPSAVVAVFVENRAGHRVPDG